MYPTIVCFMILITFAILYIISKKWNIDTFISEYTHFNLTQNPRANNGAFPLYQWWKHFRLSEEAKKYEICDQYRCKTHLLNGYNASPDFNGVITKSNSSKSSIPMQIKITNEEYESPKLYSNPETFCKINPNNKKCQNNWLLHE